MLILSVKLCEKFHTIYGYINITYLKIRLSGNINIPYQPKMHPTDKIKKNE